MSDERDGTERNEPGAKTGAEMDAITARRAEAWRLRVDEHRSYRDIAGLLGVAVSTACNDVQSVLASRVPSDAEIGAYRAQLIGVAATRAELAFQRADELFDKADAQALILEGPRGGLIVNGVGPALYGTAARWERVGQGHVDRLAKWSGVERALAEMPGPDPDAAEGEIQKGVEQVLLIMAEADRRRQAATEGTEVSQ